MSLAKLYMWVANVQFCGRRENEILEYMLVQQTKGWGPNLDGAIKGTRDMEA